LRTSQDIVVTVVTLLAYGCPVQAVVMAFGLDERTVQNWQSRSGRHCHQVHEHLVEHPRDLGQVQADEIRVKMQGLVVWMAMAIQVQTRLWLGGVISHSRDKQLMHALMQRVRRCALCRSLLFCVDGCREYIDAIRKTFREPIPGQIGRPRLRAWDGIIIAQVVKQYAHGRMVGVIRRIVQGAEVQVKALLRTTQGAGVINTAYIERLNATFRSRIATLVRRGRALARQMPTLHEGMYLVGTVYNFCTYHKSLRVPLFLPNHRRRWLRRTPAIAAGLTDHRWSVKELLLFRVPPPFWQPPKRRGRLSNAMKGLIVQWCT
jgi:transposase-like protein